MRVSVPVTKTPVPFPVAKTGTISVGGDSVPVAKAPVHSEVRRSVKQCKEAITRVNLELPSLKTLFRSDVMIARLAS